MPKTADGGGDKKQPRSLIVFERVCKDGFWHKQRIERWQYEDGTIESEAVLEDIPTDERCEPPRAESRTAWMFNVAVGADLGIGDEPTQGNDSGSSSVYRLVGGAGMHF